MDIQAPLGRTLPTIYIIACIIKFLLSMVLVASLIVGYALSFKVVTIGPVSLGLYGIILLTDFLVQFSCALINRIKVNRIAARAKRDNETAVMNGDISIAVVGYREDDGAWRKCLRSLQQQTWTPRAIIAVVDGNEAPDLQMANAFGDEFHGKSVAVIHLPILLSTVYKEAYVRALATAGNTHKPNKAVRFWRWLRNTTTLNQLMAHKHAREEIISCVAQWEEEFNITNFDAVCFSQPHGHKRTAMFTAFAMAMYVYRSKDAIFTTDSDTLLEPNALEEMFMLLESSPNIGGVTADVKIWNRNESFLALMCGVRYWFAFNVERACQSLWGCVTCLSGPMGLYRTYDLDRILGPWSLQTFGGKETTFGDDRHLTNQLLALGLDTKYTHRTFCQSESPTQYVRWIKQQTRWSKSFFREAFWFPKAFAYHRLWLSVETTKQSLYPFILISTILHFLYFPNEGIWQPVIWLATMIGVAFIKSLFAFALTFDFSILLFSFYGIFYFFGLLPSKIYAMPTVTQTTWGTSARTSGEIAKSDGFLARSYHVGHLVIWYSVIAVGIAYFLVFHFENNLFWAVAGAPVIMSLFLYVDFGAMFKRMFSRKKTIPEVSDVQRPPRDLGKRASQFCDKELDEELPIRH
ncbi:hyaluronan synthase 2 [Mycena floridula]|nr:hyaluronan synthase 2 [Mycena floridula]